MRIEPLYHVFQEKGYVYMRTTVKGIRVGMASLRPTPYGHELDDVMVFRKHQRRGIATKMIWSGLQHCSLVRLCCTGNLIPFYEKIGFKVIEEKCSEKSKVRMEWKK